MKVIQLGTVVPVRVTVSLESTSAVVTVYVYAASSVAAVTAVLVIVGASLVLVTVTMNVSVTVPAADADSVAVTITVCVPTFVFRGVPDSTPADDIVIVEGIPDAEYVSVSPTSTSAKFPDTSRLKAASSAVLTST